MDIDAARDMAYTADAWTLVFAAAESQGEVRDYLLFHAKNQCGEIADAEETYPWYKAEDRLLALDTFPLPSWDPQQESTQTWLAALGAGPKCRERDWRILLCALASCRSLGGLEAVFVKAGYVCEILDKSWAVDGLAVSARHGAHQVRFRRYDFWVAYSFYGWGVPPVDYGPMGIHKNDGTVCGVERLIAIARQLRIEPPDRVIKRAQDIELEKEAEVQRRKPAEPQHRHPR